MKLDIRTLDGKAAGSIDLADAVFGIAEIRKDILARMVNWQLAKRRAGTHKTLSRGEVSRSHSKLYRQKGTGRARHGAANAPIFRGGGHAHNRLPRDYEHALPKKVRALALKHALSAKAGAKELIVVDTLSMKDAKTKVVRARLEALGAANALIIGGAELDMKFALAARNIPNIDVLPSAGLNVYDIMRRSRLILTKDAVDAINARFGVGAAAAAKAPRKRAAKAEAEA
ncbi:MAG: 50S ribosomal protein L4 [Hyphomonadaceae bacterium]|nr:50S ribosomal protein L4 [Hyphomonadaceae bacterium]